MATLVDKRLNFVTHITAVNQAILDAADAYAARKAEWDANAYAAGASPTANNITDANLSGTTFGYMTAAQLNSLIGALATVKATIDANRGYLEAARA